HTGHAGGKPPWLRLTRVMCAFAVALLAGCGSQNSFMPQSSMPTNTRQSAASSTQGEFLYVVFNDGCNQGETGDCVGTIVPFALKTNGSPGAAGRRTPLTTSPSFFTHHMYTP